MTAFFGISQSSVVTAFGVLSVIWILSIICSIYMFVRTELVYRWRSRELEYAYEWLLGNVDLNSDEEVKEAIEEMERRSNFYHNLPSYNDMMLRFWVWPLDRFKAGIQ